ncbi:hypothetical protein [Streptomyces sp. NPDC046939]|uniref:hypothetical protein n=1 Tax=Streptomyces sp. NPDC046939 TaxID=3155376 RepID=UPI0034053D67
MSDLKKRYRVTLHAHAKAVAVVEASDYTEANFLARAAVEEKNAQFLPVTGWTPVMTRDLHEEAAEGDCTSTQSPNDKG